MEQQFGIENLKKLIGFGCGLTRQIAESLSDGWQWTDVFSFVDEMSSIPGVVKTIPAVKQEIAELSEEERKDLNSFIVERFDLPNDKVEAFVEDALVMAISILSLVEKWKSLKEA